MNKTCCTEGLGHTKIGLTVQLPVHPFLVFGCHNCLDDPEHPALMYPGNRKICLVHPCFDNIKRLFLVLKGVLPALQCGGDQGLYGLRVHSGSLGETVNTVLGEIKAGVFKEKGLQFLLPVAGGQDDMVLVVPHCQHRRYL